MHKTDTHAFVNQLLVYTLVMICVSGSVGLGTVWLRYQISVTSNRNKQLETRIAEVERHLAETNTAIETEQGPSMLMRRNTEWHLGLVQTKESQVAHVGEQLRTLDSAEQSSLAATQAGTSRLVQLEVTPVVFRFGKSR
jgi:Tfp pilus assembly protein PilN